MDGWIESITDHAKCPGGRNENGREGLNEGVVFLFYGVNKETKIMASCPNTSFQMDGERMERVTDFIFLGSKITADGDCSREIKRPCSQKKSYNQPRQHIKKQRHYFANKGPSSQSYGFSTAHVWM